MKVWVLCDKRGKVWTYTTGLPVIYRTRKEAATVAQSLYKPALHRAVRAELTVSGEP
jgi:hypothetical protein